MCGHARNNIMGIKTLILYIGLFCSAATFTAAQQRVHNGQTQKAAAEIQVQATAEATQTSVAFTTAQTQATSAPQTQAQAAAKHFTDTLQLHFKVGKSNLDTKIGNNAGTLQHLQQFKPQNNKFILNSLKIQGSTSPEGSLRVNTRLANERANTAIEYLRATIGVQESIATEKPYIPTQKEIQDLYPDKTSRELHNMVFPNLRVANLLITYSRKGPEPKLGYTTKAPEAQAENLQPQNLPALPEPAKPAEPEPEETNKYILAIKTNLLYDALITPNLGAEVYIGKGISVGASWTAAWWKADPENWYHRIKGGDIEAKKWLGSRPFSAEDEVIPFQGWHAGIYAQMLQYDFSWGKKGSIATRWSWGTGLTAGWSKIIGKKLSLDFALSLGYLTGEYEEYVPMDGCYVWQATKNRHWIGPTKAEVTLVWHIWKKRGTR